MVLLQGHRYIDRERRGVLARACVHSLLYCTLDIMDQGTGRWMDEWNGGDSNITGRRFGGRRGGYRISSLSFCFRGSARFRCRGSCRYDIFEDRFHLSGHPVYDRGDRGGRKNTWRDTFRYLRMDPILGGLKVPALLLEYTLTTHHYSTSCGGEQATTR